MWKFGGNLAGSTQWRKPMQLWRMNCQTINIYIVNAYACVETKCFEPCEQSSKPVLCMFQCRKYLSKFYVYEWMFRQELPRCTKEVMHSCFSLQQGTRIRFLSPDYCSFIFFLLFFLLFFWLGYVLQPRIRDCFAKWFFWSIFYTVKLGVPPELSTTLFM